MLGNKKDPKDQRLEDRPEWMREESLLVELQQKLGDAEKLVTRLLGEYVTASSSFSSQVVVSRARALLSGGGGAPAAGSRTQSEVQADLAQAREDRAVLIEAVGMQRTLVEKLRYALSVEICELGIREEHRKISAKVAAAARLLAEASEAERDFRERLSDRGIAWQAGGIKTMIFPRIGRLAEHGSVISTYLREAEEYI
jgi:hypothetical protein